jgi:hypothetical protein
MREERKQVSCSKEAIGPIEELGLTKVWVFEQRLANLKEQKKAGKLGARKI